MGHTHVEINRTSKKLPITTTSEIVNDDDEDEDDDNLKGDYRLEERYANNPANIIVPEIPANADSVEPDELRRSTRNRNPPERYGEEVPSETIETLEKGKRKKVI